MPCMEKLIDDLRLDMAKTDEERAFAKGLICGKTKARKEVLILAIFVIVIYVAVSL